MNPNREDEIIRLPGPGGGGGADRPTYKFTAEEMRVLRECNRDSFFQRCLPLSAVFGTVTYLGVNSGYFRPSPRFGPVPKVAVAVVVGYFLGKFSYQRKCAERLMQLPNSPIGEMLRQRRKGILQETLEPGLGPGMSLAPFSGIGSGDTYSDVNPRGNVDIDTTRPDNDGLNDSHRPSLDNPIYEEEMPPMQKHETTYEELRKKNREEYQQKRTANFRETAPLMQRTPVTLPTEEPTSPPLRRNKYGDEMI